MGHAQTGNTTARTASQTTTAAALREKAMSAEAELKRAVQDYLGMLQAQGKCIYLRLQSGVMLSEYQGRKRAIRMCPKGTPDFEIISFGKVVFLELKAPKGRQSPEQLEFAARAIEQGAGYVLARTLDEVMEVVN